MPRPLPLIACLLAAACVTTTERSGSIVTTGAPITSGTAVYDPYIKDYVILPDGTARVTYYDEQVTTSGVLVIIQPICGPERRPYPIGRPYPPDRYRGPGKRNAGGTASTSTVTINCR